MAAKRWLGKSGLLFTTDRVSNPMMGPRNRPSSKPAPFRRWSKGSALHGNVLFDGVQIHADELIDALNRHRVVLPNGGHK